MQSNAQKNIPSDSKREPLKVMIVTGEASGDVHAAELLKAIKLAKPDVYCFGMGGSHLAAAGMEVIVDSAKHASVMGLVEVFGALGGIIKAFRQLVAAAKEHRPDVVVLLDFPDFNMRLAKAVRKYTRHCVYFIAPQVWAWRHRRVHALKRDCSKIVPIFPFEERFYAKHGVEATWLGHPFLDSKPTQPLRKHFLRSHGLDPNRPVIALLPGSRKAEVERLAVCMRESWKRVTAGRPGVQAIVPVAPSLDVQWVEAQFSNPEIAFVHADAADVLSCVDAAVVASGTATLEAALCQVPFVIVYKVSPLTFHVGSALVKGTEFIGMPNIVAGKEIVKEFIQDDCQPGAIAAEVERLLADNAYRSRCVQQLSEVASMLTYSGPNEDKTTVGRVADALLSLVEGESKE